VNTTAHPLVERYLRDLCEALRDLPRRQRDELVAEIASHIEQTLPPDASDAEVLTALDRMGEPEQIAGAERERLGVEQPTSGWLEWLAIPLLLLGGIVIPGVGWVIGLVFLWLSRAWTVRDKTLATLLVPGGLLPALLLVALPPTWKRARPRVACGMGCRGQPPTAPGDNRRRQRLRSSRCSCSWQPPRSTPPCDSGGGCLRPAGQSFARD
jgi:hypothetical protein